MCLGIDHSAISVSESARSVVFYEELGFRVAARSLNQGIEQECLDGVRNACVEVTALEPRQATPHLELLCYRSVAHDQSAVLHSNDVAATCLVLENVGPSSEEQIARQQPLTDPDGHHLLFVPRTTGGTTAREITNAFEDASSAPVALISESIP